MSLSTTGGGDIEILDDALFSEQLEKIADCFKQGKLHLPGVVIDLHHLQPVEQNSLENKIQLKEQIDALQQTLHTLEQQLAVAGDLAGKTREKDRLYQDLLQAEEDIKKFGRYQQMLEISSEQQALQSELEIEEDKLQEQLAEVQHKASTLSDRRNLVSNKQEQIKRQAERIEQEKKSVSTSSSISTPAK